MPTTPDGITAINTLIHKFQVSCFSCIFLLWEKGFNLLKYNITTAKMEPSCTTTKNVLIYSVEKLSLIN